MTRAGSKITFGIPVAVLVLCAGACRQSGGTGAADPVPRSHTMSTSSPGGATSAAAPPGAGSCHARGGGLDVLPDPACTPGATNPAVTQSDIGQTICRSGWTATVRPPVSFTEPLKYSQMAAYGLTGPASNYEEDHLIPLELGGSPASAQNLWPEPGASPNGKDSVESAAKQAVCDGQMTLVAAQRAIAADWIAFGQQLGVVPGQSSPGPGPGPAPSSPAAAGGGGGGGGGGTCTASAAYSSRYGDWDVYVRSDQPNQTVQITASGGETASYHTNSNGYADVYLHAPAGAGGQRVAVTVGRATCSTTL